MSTRCQKTLRTAVELKGFGLFGGQDVCLTILPAPEFYGRVFQRTDLKNSPLVPALSRYVQPCFRRTVIARDGASVELTEHILAALYGLQVDNCLIQIDADEVPVMDGSAYPFVEAILAAGIEEQSADAVAYHIKTDGRVSDQSGSGSIHYTRGRSHRTTLSYGMNYDHPGIGRQRFQLEVSPESFLSEVAFARTFIPADEVEVMRNHGFGARATTENVLVLDENGPTDGIFRAPDECARHKILDCLGDFALLGCDIIGTIEATRSGHALNHKAVEEWSRGLSQSTRRRLAG